MRTYIVNIYFRPGSRGFPLLLLDPGAIVPPAKNQKTQFEHQS